MRVLLTDTSVPELEVKPGQENTLYTDSELPGFGCRVSPTRRAWTIQYKLKKRVAAISMPSLMMGGYGGPTSYGHGSTTATTVTTQWRSATQRTCIGYWPEMNASEARSLAEAVKELGLKHNLHPTEALRKLTGNGSRGVLGERPRKRPGLVRWSHMRVSLDRAVSYAYLLWLEARFDCVSGSESPPCSGDLNNEAYLAEGLHALPGSDYGSAR